MSISKTVVIGCAGIGSRLGLGQSKALINIHGKPLIHWQLELLKDIDDVRVVVGYQANEVIKTILEVRKNVTFVFNHNYFNTKTATSIYLASKEANDYIFTLDGDVIIHPDDMQTCLDAHEPFIGITDISSDEAVLVRLDEQTKCVTSFSRDSGTYEWIGPALLKKEMFSYTKDKHLYEIIENELPIASKKVRSMDIDTMNDYYKALKKFKEWHEI